MAIKSKKNSTTSQDSERHPCGTLLPDGTFCTEELREGKQHCRGSVISLYRSPVHELRKEGFTLAKIVPEYHHGHKWAPCWKCGGDMGCSLCVPSGIELYCRRCNVAANLETLLNGGPPLGMQVMFDQNAKQVKYFDDSARFPKLQDYPRAWVNAWVQQCIQAGVNYEGDGKAEIETCWQAMRALMGGGLRGV